MTTEEKQNLINKIVSLLALADSGSGATPAEARLAMMKAQQLRTKYAIDEAAIINAQIDRSKGTMPASFNIKHETWITNRKYRVMHDEQTAAILTKCFGVKVLWTFQNGFHTYLLIGDEMDMRIAMAIAPHLFLTIQHAINGYFKGLGQKWVLATARAFANGLMRGYIEGSEEGKTAARAVAKRKDADAYSIVLVDKDNAICAYMEKTFRTKVARRVPRGQANDGGRAFAAGVAAGSTMSVTPKLN